MESFKRKKGLFYLTLFLFLTLFDQLSKNLSFNKYSHSTCNTEFSLQLGFSWALFWLLWSGIILAGIYLFFYHKKWLSVAGYVPIILIFSGAASNTMDRLYFGCVRDIIPFFYNLFIFNLADLFIFFGALIIIRNVLTKSV